MRYKHINIFALFLILFLAACNSQAESQPEVDYYVSGEHAEEGGYAPDEYIEGKVKANIVTTQPPSTYEPTEPAPLPESTHPSYSWILQPIYTSIEQIGYGLVRLRDDGRYGLYNVITDQVIISPKYPASGWIGAFPHFIPTMLDGNIGVINAEGEVVLPFEYAHVQIQADYGVAIVTSGDRRYAGIVELSTGREIVPFGLYHSIMFSRGGIAQTQRRYGSGVILRSTNGFINIVTGEEVVPLIYDRVNAFSEGLAAVQADGLWGFINTTGEVVIPLVYDQIMSSVFINGTIAINRDGLWGIIDATGAYILPPTHDRISWPIAGVAAFGTKDPTSQNIYWGILDMRTGKEIVPAIYHGWHIAGEGIALMRLGDWENYINVLINLETGHKFAPFPYAIGDEIEYRGPMPPHFSNGRGIVHVIDQEEWGWTYGIVDSGGREILPPVYESVDWFSEGFFRVSKGPSQWGIVDSDGNEVLPLIYCFIEPEWKWRFRSERQDANHNLAAINIGGEWVEITGNPSQPDFRMKGGFWGFIDNNGQIVVPLELDFVQVHSTGHDTAAVQMPNGLWGLIRIHLYRFNAI